MILQQRIEIKQKLLCSWMEIFGIWFWGYDTWFGPVAQLVRAPPCHGGGRGFEPHPGRFDQKYLYWDLSSAGRASALQAEGHRFEPYRSHLSHYMWYADMAQLAEQLICNQQVNGSSPFIGFWWQHHMDGFPSGQRGQTVNLLQIASVVRIHLCPFFYCFYRSN